MEEGGRTVFGENLTGEVIFIKLGFEDGQGVTREESVIFEK